ncbi:LuxR C-terminal-related transcriptional regulator [Streptomyces sp. NPDC049906]|uniref:helix-turn-helix transcriptional regulator n=1 Tax=Streptomyces sp. NPDC049906 TaxID=3155656 RepID=UPI003415F4A5
MAEAHVHGVDQLCEEGDRVYVSALKGGRVARAVAAGAPCLVDLGLLYPDPEDTGWLVPEPPGAVVGRLARGLDEELAQARDRAYAVVRLAERYTGYCGPAAVGGASGVPGLRVLEGKPRIREAIAQASDECAVEHLAIQPGGVRREGVLSDALPLALDMAGRGVRMRTLYTHAARHGQGLFEYVERVGGAVRVRTLDEVTERLLIFDRAVAFVPATEDRTTALELRHPGLVEFLAIVFERLWRLAHPFGEAVPTMTPVDGITRREWAIAALLAEGHTDAEIAQRLGINVRTARHHIRKLAEELGAVSRAQLGVRIAQAGLDVPPRPPVPGG